MHSGQCQARDSLFSLGPWQVLIAGMNACSLPEGPNLVVDLDHLHRRSVSGSLFFIHSFIRCFMNSVGFCRS